jgi:thiamine-monophosphate kinase
MATRGRQRPGEFELIERYFRPLATDAGAFDLSDDAALYNQRPDEDLVISTDMLAEGVHFLPDDAPDVIARRALRVNLSDLAAKGATPFGYFLSLALPGDWTEAFLKKFAQGLKSDQSRFGITLLGGDTIKASRGLTISVTAIGRVPKGRMILRSGARPGEAIFVSGTIGDAALGLRLRRGKIDPAVAGRGTGHLLERQRAPQARVALIPVLRRHATSSIDVSDGLVGDFGHICTASGVSGQIDGFAVPLSRPAQKLLAADRRLLQVILNGGDDYEILATVAEPSATLFMREAEAAGVTVTRIGRVVAGDGPPMVLDATGTPITMRLGSHTHF